MSQIKLKLKEFIIEITDEIEVNDDTQLIDSGIIDSINFIELIIFIEQNFSIENKIENFQVADFNTISSLENSILRKQTNLINEDSNST